MTIMQRINRLSAERSRLYRLADERRGDAAVRDRAQEISREIEALWGVRRQERAGQHEGIDGVVDRAYRRVYGPDYDDATTLSSVDRVEDEKAGVAA